MYRDRSNDHDVVSAEVTSNGRCIKESSCKRTGAKGSCYEF